MAVGTWAASSKAEDAKAPAAIIDTHQHLWNLTTQKLPWLAGAPEKLKKDYTNKEYQEATAGLNIKAVYMEVNVAPEQQVAEAEHVISLAESAKHATVAAVISGQPSSDDFEKYIRRFSVNPYIKGVRRVLHDPEIKQGTCLEKNFVGNMRLLGALGLSFDLCMRPRELSDGVKLAQQCPDTRFIVDHCGMPRIDDFCWIAVQETNVYGGLAVALPFIHSRPRYFAEVISELLFWVGEDKILFGSDYAIWTPRWLVEKFWNFEIPEDIKAEHGVDLTPDAKRKILGLNAARLYGIDIEAQRAKLRNEAVAEAAE